MFPQLLEHLYCSKWTKLDGLGALVITPTRELAYQIFETLRNVGRFHDVSAGLIIGGKDLHFEKNRLDHCNVIICTPGRLLQHMDTNPLFNCDNLKVGDINCYTSIYLYLLILLTFGLFQVIESENDAFHSTQNIEQHQKHLFYYSI